VAGELAEGARALGPDVAARALGPDVAGGPSSVPPAGTWWLTLIPSLICSASPVEECYSSTPYTAVPTTTKAATPAARGGARCVPAEDSRTVLDQPRTVARKPFRMMGSSSHR
jgi:hypothetical protein